MAAATLHILIEQGSDFKLQLTLKQSGVPIDISAWSFAGEIRKQRRITATLVATFAFVIVDAAAGRVDMIIDSGADEASAIGQWPYDVEYNDGSGTKRRLLRGNAKVTGQVTALT